MIAFEGVRAVTMGPAGVLEKATVIVQGERIVDIGDPSLVDVPEGARRIDGEGFTLIPGLIDLHVHIGDAVDLDLYVAAGVTTVRALGGSLWHLGLRDRVAAGRLGPDMQISGPNVSGVSTADEARGVVRRQSARGFDWLKIYGEITPEAYAALVVAAREHGLRPCGHVPRNLRVEDVLTTPPDSIDHAEEFLYGWFDGRNGRASIPELTQRVAESGVAVVTTLSCYDLIGRHVVDLRDALVGDRLPRHVRLAGPGGDPVPRGLAERAGLRGAHPGRRPAARPRAVRAERGVRRAHPHTKRRRGDSEEPPRRCPDM